MSPTVVSPAPFGPPPLAVSHRAISGDGPGAAAVVRPVEPPQRAEHVIEVLVHGCRGGGRIAVRDRLDDLLVLAQRQGRPTGLEREPELVPDDLTAQPLDDRRGRPVPGGLPDQFVQPGVQLGVFQRIQVLGGLPRSAALAAMRPSTTRRTSVISMASARLTRRTRAPRCRCSSISPSVASSCRAVRTTERLAPYSADNSASMSRWPGTYSPRSTASRMAPATSTGGLRPSGRALVGSVTRLPWVNQDCRPSCSHGRFMRAPAYA